jgi:hypothetical protein
VCGVVALQDPALGSTLVLRAMMEAAKSTDILTLTVLSVMTRIQQPIHEPVTMPVNGGVPA